MSVGKVLRIMNLRPRLLRFTFHIDTNLINGRQKIAAVNLLEQWRKDGVILMMMSGTAYVEAKQG
jgi:hypothetical protein